MSIVYPACDRIVTGQKKLEIRSWLPDQLPLKDVVIIQNTQYLNEEGDEQMGEVVALIDIESVHAWQPDEVDVACATQWQDGYWAWEISHIRPVLPRIKAMAKRKIYAIELEL